MNDKEYFSNLSLQNKNAIKDAINNKINDLPEASKIEVLIEELSTLISTHGTRLDIIEAIIAKEFNLDKEEKKVMQLEALPAEIVVTQTFEKELHWSATELPENDNIYPIEYVGDKAICWTGADASTFIHTPRLKGQRFVLQLGIEAVIESELLNDIEVRCNGRLLRSKIKYLSGQNFIIAPFKVRRNEKNGARFEVTISKTASPSQLGLSGDMRLLGFAISELNIIPRPSAVHRIRNKLITS